MKTLILLTIGCAFGSGYAFGQNRGGGSGHSGGYSRPSGGTSRPRTVYVPYGIPISPGYAGGYASGYGPGYGNGYAPYYGDPNAGYYPGGPYYDPNAPSPAVVINQNYQPEAVHPVLNDYSDAALPPAGYMQAPPIGGSPNVQRLDQNASAAQDLSGARSSPSGPSASRDDQPTIFLIAMKDHTIYPVIAYWVEKDTLNYVTVDTVVKHVPVDQVDRDLSRQLNDERNVEFKLPSR